MSFHKVVNDLAGREGFESWEKMLCFYVMQGYRLRDFLYHLERRHRYYYSYEGAHKQCRNVYRNLLERRRRCGDDRKKQIEKVRAQYNSKINVIKNCKNPLGWRSFPEAVKNLRRSGLSEKKIAETFDLSPMSYSRLKRYYCIKRYKNLTKCLML